MYVVRGCPSLEAFYAELPPGARERSMEVDYGVMWTDPLLPGQVIPWPRWRVSWIEATGEVYALAASRDGTGRCPVRLYGVVEGRAQAEAFLDGWADHCGPPGGLAWLEGLFREQHARQAGDG